MVTTSGWGSLDRGDVRAAVWLIARGKVRRLSPFSVARGRFQAARSGRGIMGEFTQLELSQAPAVETFLIDGFGRVEGGFRLDGTRIDGEVTAQGLDLGALSEFGRPFLPQLAGRVSFHVTGAGSLDEGFDGSSYGRASEVVAAGIRTSEGSWSLRSQAGMLTGMAQLSLAQGKNWARIDVEDVRLNAIRNADIVGALGRDGHVTASAVADVSQSSELLPNVEVLRGLRGRVWVEAALRVTRDLTFRRLPSQRHRSGRSVRAARELRARWFPEREWLPPLRPWRRREWGGVRVRRLRGDRGRGRRVGASRAQRVRVLSR